MVKLRPSEEVLSQHHHTRGETRAEPVDPGDVPVKTTPAHQKIRDGGEGGSGRETSEFTPLLPLKSSHAAEES